MSTPDARAASRREELLAELCSLADAEQRRGFLAGHRELLEPAVVESLCEEASKTWRADTPKALGLAAAALAIAEDVKDARLLGLAWRTHANALYFSGRNQESVAGHEKALALFEQSGDAAQAARTLNASIQPLILLGEYERAHRAAERAREIFTREKNGQRLAHLDINVGNLFHRQDRFPEALACYDRAYACYERLRNAEGMAVALHNSAVSLICLNDYAQALACYERSRQLAERHGMPLLAAQADYNISYLYFFRGEYGRAIQMLRDCRQRCQEVGDKYHLALTYLDQSEIYLELNLSEEATQMAEQAALRFQELAMGYEAAKAMAFQAMAAGQQGKSFVATELFEKSRALFVREQNLVWPWLIDLYRALILFNEGRLFEARRLCAGALGFFRSSYVPTKAILSQLLMARMTLRAGAVENARRECQEALDQLGRLEAPALAFQAHFLLGQIQEAAGERDASYVSYQAAREALESLRSSLRGEELKIGFMRNKLEVYEALVELCMHPGRERSREAFAFMEQAKSRSLMDMLFSGTQALSPQDTGQSELVRRVRSLREELNWYYRRIEQEHLRHEERSLARIDELQKQARERESEFLHALHEMPAAEPERLGMRPASSVSLEEVQATLTTGAAMVVYFSVRGRFVAALVTHDGLQIVPLTPVSRVKNLLGMLQFQLAKFRLTGEYVATFQGQLLQATQGHLRGLYAELLAPLLELWQGEHLIIVPHGLLHYLPFHALYDGSQYVVDRLTVSYAPSASIYALCHTKAVPAQTTSLILGVPDPQAPFILEEVQAVAATLPSSDLFVGEQATAQVLREKGGQSRIVHIAAHGHFRADNPMFSSIRLGQSFLSLCDLYQLRLPAELVTLSGCATGLNVVAAGDELLGLVRGLLYAGAQSLLLTLWEVHDKSTAEFMRSFYATLQKTGDKAGAVRQAMFDLRERYPHPYYWAPFLLVGKVFQTT